MSASYAIYTSPNHPLVAYHLPTLIVTPFGQPQHILYSYVHTNYNNESYLLTPSMMGELCVAKAIPPPGSRRLGGPPAPPTTERNVYCEASRNLRWTIINTGINAPVYKLTLPNPDMPGHDQPLFQISKPNPNDTWWTMFYFTYGGHQLPPKRIEFGRIQKNATASSGGGSGTRVTITGRTPEQQAVWHTLGEGNEDMVEWIVIFAALNLIDEEIVRAAARTTLSDTPLQTSTPASQRSTRPATAQPRAAVAQTQGATFMASGTRTHPVPGSAAAKGRKSGRGLFGLKKA